MEAGTTSFRAGLSMICVPYGRFHRSKQRSMYEIEKLDFVDSPGDFPKKTSFCDIITYSARFWFQEFGRNS